MYEPIQSTVQQVIQVTWQCTSILVHRSGISTLHTGLDNGYVQVCLHQTLQYVDRQLYTCSDHSASTGRGLYSFISFITLRAKQCIAVSVLSVCLQRAGGVWLCVCVCLFVCLFVGQLPWQLEIACIDLHQTGSVGKVNDHLLVSKFWPSAVHPREGGLWRGEIFFWLRLTTASAQCLRLSERFFSFTYLLRIYKYKQECVTQCEPDSKAQERTLTAAL